ncbi:serine hydrolase [Roseivirga sp. BDSF3-8]|uniref:serine hydrolase n=1 Tax=Roseivirga sp. BDSF3-8 TaxID=3241598 RepID=UPI0035323969
MKKALFFYLLLLASLPLAAQDSDLARRLDKLMTDTYPEGEPGATVIVKQGDDILLRKAYGMADMELQVPMQPENIFRLGSITKQFTAVSILKLREEGKLELDEKITTYLKDYPAETGDKVTVRQLLNHTSGIPSYTSQSDFPTYMTDHLSLSELIDKFKTLPLDFEPGTEWSYNNSGYILLGAIIEAVSGKSYEEYVEQELFAPLGMEHSYYGNVKDIIPGRVEGYGKDGENIIVAPYLSMSLPHAAGSLVSNVDDLAVWDKALYEGNLLPAESLKEAWTGSLLANGADTRYGFGWQVGQVGEYTSIEHGGGINGFRTMMIRVPEKELLVAVLQNREWDAPVNLAVSLAETALNTGGEPIAVKIKPKKLKEYTGNYRVTDEAFRVVSIRNDTLFSKRTRQPGFALIPVAKDEFYSPGDNYGRFIFKRDNKGNITQLVFRPRGGMESPSFRTDDPAPAEPEVVEADPASYDRYIGKYQLAPAFALTVFTQGESLMIQGTGQQAIEVFPKSDKRFFAKVVNAEIEFLEENGEIQSLVLYQGGQELPGKKVE